MRDLSVMPSDNSETRNLMIVHNANAFLNLYRRLLLKNRKGVPRELAKYTDSPTTFDIQSYVCQDRFA